MLKDGKIDRNPFSDVIPKRNDKLRRLPLSDDDMALVRANLHTLRPEDQLLWKFLACTVMRLDEPFQIKREYEELGVKYVIVGSKTEQSKRRVPLPECLLQALPKRIQGPLFEGGTPGSL